MFITLLLKTILYCNCQGQKFYAKNIVERAHIYVYKKFKNTQNQILSYELKKK